MRCVVVMPPPSPAGLGPPRSHDVAQRSASRTQGRFRSPRRQRSRAAPTHAHACTRARGVWPQARSSSAVGTAAKAACTLPALPWTQALLARALPWQPGPGGPRSRPGRASGNCAMAQQHVRGAAPGQARLGRGRSYAPSAGFLPLSSLVPRARAGCGEGGPWRWRQRPRRSLVRRDWQGRAQRRCLAAGDRECHKGSRPRSNGTGLGFRGAVGARQDHRRSR